MFVWMSLLLDGVCRGGKDADATAPAPRMKISATLTIMPEFISSTTLYPSYLFSSDVKTVR